MNRYNLALFLLTLAVAPLFYLSGWLTLAAAIGIYCLLARLANRDLDRSGRAPFPARARERKLTMKYFGTVKAFDAVKGHGEIKQEVGGIDLGFEMSAFQWDKKIAPTVGQRLSYDVGTNSERQPCALNLQAV